MSCKCGIRAYLGELFDPPWVFVLLLWLCLLWSYLGELLDRVGLRVDGDDGHDKEDGEADDLVRGESYG